MFSTPVILCPVHRILWQQVTNLINKFAILLHKYRFTQDYRHKFENDWCRGRLLNTICKFFKSPSPADKPATSPRTEDVTGLLRLARNDKRQSEVGRSMIEMLGVLAIIAVLSVVGLNGFSKAMRMYRSAVQKETLEQILANMVKIRNNLNHKTTTWDNISYVFAAIGELPDGVTLKDNRLYDKSGNSFTVYFGNNTWKTPSGKASSFEYHVRVNWEQKDNLTSPTAFDSCINTLEVAKANSNEVKQVTQYIGNSEAFLSYDQSNILMKNMTAPKMHQTCKNCAGKKSCSIILYINP